MKATDNPAKKAATTSQETWFETVRSQAALPGFGMGPIDVRDSAVGQIGRAEKVRLDEPPTANPQPPTGNPAA